MADLEGSMTVDSLPRTSLPLTALPQTALSRTTLSQTVPAWSVSVGSAAWILSLYGTAHMAVDVICAALVLHFSTITAYGEVFGALFFLYHALAFGLQPIFGLIVDGMKTPRLAAVAGGLISVLAISFSAFPLVAIVIVGIGNALFHVGGGVVCLRITPERTTAPGLFVAPGSMGLFLGVLLGKYGSDVGWLVLVVSTLAITVLMACTPIPNAQQVAPQAKKLPRGELILGLILLSIMVRSLLGFLVSFSWEIQPAALLAMILAVMTGKALGGILADRWGWIRVGVGSMLASLPFLMCGTIHPLAAIPGLFLLNIAMPITLVATVKTLPDFPGFAFGLTCLAILLGAMPTLLGVAIHEFWMVGLVLLLAAVGLFRGLQLLFRSTLCREELSP